jgi:hypothetical protein
MSNEDVAPSLKAWFEDTDVGPDDVRRSASRVTAEARYIRQRGRWWPLPMTRNREGTSMGEQPALPLLPASVPAASGYPGSVKTRPTFALGTRLVLGALVLALGGVLILAQPFGQEAPTVPGAATAPGSPLPEELASPNPSPDRAPVGLIAMGHAALLGTDSDPSRAPGYPEPQNSWVTGTAPDVDSIYERLVAARPETEGHVSNQASLVFAQSTTLNAQAKAALAVVPTPELVIIQTIDNDIRCDGTDEEHIARFGEAVTRALDTIATASPESRILMVGARPIRKWVAFVEANPRFKESLPEGHGRTDWTGTGMCDVFDEAGQLVPQHVETLARIYDAYEAEQERVCALVPQCRTDGDLDDEYVYEAKDWSDWAFLSTEGNAAMADHYWPLVVDILGLPS